MGLKQSALYTVSTLSVELSIGVVKTNDMRVFVVALLCVAASQAMPALETETNDPGLVGSVIGVVKDCVEGDVSLCLKVIISAVVVIQ